MDIFLAPHNDDETLFGAFTIMREKPLVVVVTDSFIQPNRGDVGCSARTRRAETTAAMKLLGAPVFFAGLRDDTLEAKDVYALLDSFVGVDKVYAPAIQGGNEQHDMIGKAADQVFFGKVIHYSTYAKGEHWTPGNTEIVPTKEENGLKLRALNCYASQINLPSTRQHFLSALNKSEWLVV